MKSIARSLFLCASIAPIAVFSSQQGTKPMAEQVYKDIQVLKGVPASDIGPTMQFMSASLGWNCDHCHEADYAAPTQGKDAAREMILMQRDINTKHFRGNLEVTCMTCHNGKGHPENAGIPATGLNYRHPRISPAPKFEDLFAKHIAAVGKSLPSTIVRTGTLTAPNEQTHKVETSPVTLIQTSDGKFKVDSTQKFGSDGTQVWYGTYPMTDEGAAFFGRVGRLYAGDKSFDGLEKPTVPGKDTLGKSEVVVVRAERPGTDSREEMWFDSKSGLLLKLVNMKRSSLGTAITTLDYSNYKAVGGVKVPMKVVMTYGGIQVWTFDFKTAKADVKVDDAMFKMGG